ncbi:MAG: hypothetical protein IJ590_00710 [Rickettsiales bacterium]|nr:hypothetical protein [Rickettsiales bacterium]
MSLIKLFASALNKYNHFMIVLTFLPFLVIEYKKNSKAVFNIFFTIFIALAMSILAKALFRVPHPVNPNTFAFPSSHCWIIPLTAYCCMNCLLKDKKLCMKWLVFFMAVETFICVAGGHHTWFECIVGLIGCILSLVAIEWYSKKMNHIKFVLGYLFGISVCAFAWYVSPSYGRGSVFNAGTFGAISCLLYVCPILMNCNHKKKKITK